MTPNTKGTRVPLPSIVLAPWAQTTELNQGGDGDRSFHLSHTLDVGGDDELHTLVQIGQDIRIEADAITIGSLHVSLYVNSDAHDLTPDEAEALAGYLVDAARKVRLLALHAPQDGRG